MSAFSSCRRPKSRRCRAYRAKTVLFVEQSVASWQAIFGRSVVLPSWKCGSCSELAGLVKSFLGRDVSDVPMEQLSFQSIKKGLPASCECMTSGMIDKLVSSLGSSPVRLPPRYLDFVRSECRALFRKGWDASYESFCLTVTPPLSAVLASKEKRRLCSALGGRADGGCLGQVAGEQDAFLDCVLHGQGAIEDLEGSLLVVQSAGKPRPLSKFQASALALKPLHKTLYGFMKKFPWLLVGDPTASRLDRAGFREGEGELVSGDYASATDGLSIEVAEAILGVVLERSVFVPENVRRGALSALRPLLLYGDDLESSFRPVRGQMMGSYLSFPLLCLQNYLAFRWSLLGTGVRRVPLLINGDDILFQRTGHFPRWSSAVGSVGLTVEPTKTSVERGWGTINSTLLEWRGGRLRPSWSARFGMFRPAEHPGSLGKSFLDFLRGLDEPALRFRAGREFFRWHLGELRSAGVSPVSLGFRGLLARRLSKVYSLLQLPLVDFPAFFSKHDVGYDADFVTRHEIGALSGEELFQSSLELGSEKWARGWMPASLEQRAFAYCQARASVKDRRFDYPSVGAWFGLGDREFSFRLRNLPPADGPPKVGSKAFLQPFAVPADVLVSWRVLDALRLDHSLVPEQLPSYREACQDAAAW